MPRFLTVPTEHRIGTHTGLAITLKRHTQGWLFTLTKNIHRVGYYPDKEVPRELKAAAVLTKKSEYMTGQRDLLVCPT